MVGQTGLRKQQISLLQKMHLLHLLKVFHMVQQYHGDINPHLLQVHSVFCTFSCRQAQLLIVQ